MKQILSVLILVVFLFIGSVSFSEPISTKPSQFRMGVSHSYAYSQNKPFLVLFYTEGCISCKEFMSKMRLIEMIYGNLFNIVTIDGGDSFYKNLLQSYGVESFPSLYIADRQTDTKILLNPSHYKNFSLLREDIDGFINSSLK